MPLNRAWDENEPIVVMQYSMTPYSLIAMSPPSPAVFLPIACRVSARRLPFFCPSPTVFLPSPAVACRASTHRPAFSALACHVSARRLPCFCPSPAMFPPSPAVACRASPIARLFPPSPALFLPVACHVPPIAYRRVPRFRPSLGFFPAVACIVS